MTTVGYARVSTADQDPQAQHAALVGAGAERVYIERAGSAAERAQLAAALDYLRSGDQLVVWKLDRLGRSLSHLINILEDLRARGVSFRSLTEGMDTTTPAGELLFHVAGAFAQFERELIRERTRTGLDAARARGRRGGRRRALNAQQVRYARRMHAEQVTVSDIARALKCGRTTVYRALADDRPV